MRIMTLFAIVLFLAGCGKNPPLDMLGAYRLEDGRVVSIRRSLDDTLRYRVYPTGETGRLYPVDNDGWVSGEGFSGRDPVVLRVRALEEGAISWLPTDGVQQRGVRFLDVEPVEFPSDGAALRGQLILPRGAGPFPAVVLVHGSGEDAATEYFYSGDFLAANGVATLVYDKRGSGSSEGEFTFDFDQLARDVVAAVDTLAGHRLIDPGRIGLCGYSQGAWVAPLAASMDERIRFVSVSYGMIESPTDEAVWETQNLLRSRGADEDDIREATPLVRASVRIVASGFSDGWDDFHEAKRWTEGAPWREMLDGSPVQQMLMYPRWLTKILGPRLAPEGLDWGYSSDDVLDSLSIPMTWLLAAEDGSAPNHETIRKLRVYQNAGKPVELIVFESADHGMLSFGEENGERIYTGYAPGYFQAEVENVLRMSTAD
jgi:dienelactone hydrolase